jgi:hypothetical protein
VGVGVERARLGQHPAEGVAAGKRTGRRVVITRRP